MRDAVSYGDGRRPPHSDGVPVTGSDTGRADRFRVEHHAEVDPTNRLALDQARAGAAPGLVVVADHQTAGRGRLDRRWEAPPGSSLLVSVLLLGGTDARAAHRAVVAVAVALADAV